MYLINRVLYVLGSYVRASHILCVLQERAVYTNQAAQIFPA